MIRKSTILTCLALLALVCGASLLNCGSSGGGGLGPNTITGSITGGTDPKVGLFDAATYWFVVDSLGEPDVVHDELDGAPEPYTPTVMGTIDAGTFTITLPAGSSGAQYYLIVWDDANADDMFSMTTETGYFAMKTFAPGTYAVRYLTWFEMMGSGEWAVGYYDGITNYIEGFSIVGRVGYNFTID
jgi:hypothetical protein